MPGANSCHETWLVIQYDFISYTKDSFMKKLALTIVCALATAVSAFAQGYGFVSWSGPSGIVTVQTNSTVYSPLFGGGSTGGGSIGPTANSKSTGLVYDFELLCQPWSGSITTDTSVWDGTWKDTGLGATNTQNGRLNPSTPPAGNIDLGQTIGWYNPTTNNIVLVGWSATLGTSWVQVSNECVQAAANPNHYFTVPGDTQNQTLCFFGESTFGYLKPNSSTPGASVFGLRATMQGLPIYSPNTQLYLLPLTTTPEPSTIALAGLGGLSLLLFRRRKQ
jgi:PEP-CTERM motif